MPEYKWQYVVSIWTKHEDKKQPGQPNKFEDEELIYAKLMLNNAGDEGGMLSDSCCKTGQHLIESYFRYYLCVCLFLGAPGPISLHTFFHF